MASADYVGGQQQQPNEPACCTKCVDGLQNMDPNALTYILKVVNIINAALLAFSGIWVFITVNPNLLLVLAALYVM